MKNISISQVQDIISRNFPETYNQELKRNSGVMYQPAKPIKVGGAFSYKLPRTIGYSGDRLFSLELVGKPDNLAYIDFCSWADTTCLARSLVSITAVIKAVYPEWNRGNELAIAVGGVKATPLEGKLRTDAITFDKSVTISKAVLINGVEAVFIKVR